jgi:hypothetical protein
MRPARRATCRGSVSRSKVTCFPGSLGLVKLHGLAESLQLGTVDAVKTHAKLKNCYAKDLRCLQIAAFNERGTIFLEGGDNRTQMRLGVRDQAQPIV